MANARLAMADVRVDGDAVEQSFRREAHGLKERSGATTREEAFAQSVASGLKRFDSATCCVRLDLLLPEVALHRALVPQIVGDRRVDVCQIHTGKAIGDLFGGSTLVEGVDHCLQRHARLPDADGSASIDAEREGFSF